MKRFKAWLQDMRDLWNFPGTKLAVFFFVIQILSLIVSLANTRPMR